MKKKIHIEGMSCEHCVAHVTEALAELGASDIEVSLEGKYALCALDKQDDDIIQAIDEQGYNVVSVNEA